MSTGPDNWKTQMRQGYRGLCILLLIQKHERIYGFDLIQKLEECELSVKEGTLYPLLNRMTADGILSAVWDTENLKGHPRKFYSVTRQGKLVLGEMGGEFEKMVAIYRKLDRARS